MYFTAEQIARYREGLAEVGPRHDALQERLVTHAYQTDGGREHAHHGMARRLGSLSRCVERVFELLPLDLDAIPEFAVREDATLNIQAFVLNAFGFCENAAWVWVHERAVTRPSGQPLSRPQVGLGPKYDLVRGALTQEFRDYLDQREPWFAHLKEFRDALAHRIPLFIPPYTVHPDNAGQHQALEAQATQALHVQDFVRYEQLRRQREALARFQPIMLHSLTEYTGYVVFHPQLLVDFNTLDELAGVLLDELDRPQP